LIGDTVYASFDSRTLSRVIDGVRRSSVEQVLKGLAGASVKSDAVAAVTAECSFDHEGVLVFPDDVTDVAGFLRAEGFEVAEPVPSVVVQERISRRYDLATDDIDVSILQASISLESGGRRGVEVFCLPRRQATLTMIEREHKENNESHFALKLERPSSAKLDALRSVLLTQFSMRPDGGGYNPHDGAGTGGRSVLYFSSPTGGRLELTCAGNFPEIVAAHRRGMRDMQDARRRARQPRRDVMRSKTSTKYSKRWPSQALKAGHHK
jgi:hypothetical protein